MPNNNPNSSNTVERSDSSFLSIDSGEDNNTMNTNTDLPPAAQFLCKVIDGCTERALLLDCDMKIIHKNPAAKHFLKEDAVYLKDILNLSEEQLSTPLQQLTAASIYMRSGEATRNQRTLRFVAAENNHNDNFTVLYIESKNEQVRAMVDHAFDAVVTTDETGVILTANPRTVELFGYSLDELLGHNIAKLCGGGHGARHASYMERYLQTGIAKVIGRARQVPCKHKDGHEFPCELGLQEITPPHQALSSNAFETKRYFCGYLKDLTLQKQQQAKIVQQATRAQAMIDASFDSMFEIDCNGIITMVNDAATSMLGWSREEFLGSNISMICGDDHGAKHDSYLQRYKETGIAHIIGRKRQVHAKRKDGSQFPIELGVKEVKLKEVDECTGECTEKTVFCGFVKDISQQHKDKKALRKQQQLIHNKFFGSGEDGNGGDAGDNGSGCPMAKR